MHSPTVAGSNPAPDTTSLRTTEQRDADLAYARLVARHAIRRECHALRRTVLLVVIAALLGALTVTVLVGLNNKEGAAASRESKNSGATEGTNGRSR